MKKFFLVLAAAAMLAPTATVQTAHANPIHQVTDNTIIVNGAVFNTQNPILNIGGSLMVPFREFGERLGATVGWYEPRQRITLTRQNMYSILYIGNSVIQHGDFVMMGNAFHPMTANQTHMDVPAMLVAGVTYIPLRAVSQAMGATVEWNPLTSTATITAAQQGITTLPGQVTPPAQETPATNLPANYGDFTNTSHFQIISARQAQSRHNDSNDYPFLVVFYNSDETESRRIVPAIQDAAQRVGLRIFGVDRANTADNNANSYNSWLWNFVRENAFEEPAMVLVNGRNDVTIHNRARITQNPTTGYAINNQFVEQTIRNFHVRAETGLNPGAFRSNTTYWVHRTSAQIRSAFQSHDEFIVVLYDGALDHAEFHVPLVVAAAGQVRHRIFAVDIDRNPQYRNHLDFLPGINTNLPNRVPMMFLVYSPSNGNVNHRVLEFDRPNSVAAAVSIIEEFIENSMFYELNNQGGSGNQQTGNAHWQSRTAAQIRTMRDNNQEFVVALYDSSLSQANQTIQAVRTGASRVPGHRIYTVDINHSSNSNFRNQLYFLPGINNNLNGITPIIFQVFNNANSWNTQALHGPHSANSAEDAILWFLARAHNLTANQPGSGNNSNNNQGNNQPQQIPGQGEFVGWNSNFTALDDAVTFGFRHENAVDIQSRWITDQNFIVMVYNPQHAASRHLASAVRDGVIASSNASLPVYAVNLQANPNFAAAEWAWLRTALGTNPQVTHPILIHVSNTQVNSIEQFNHPANLTFSVASRRAQDMIESAN